MDHAIKSGDVVRIREYEDIKRRYGWDADLKRTRCGSDTFEEHMICFCGRVHEVSFVESDGSFIILGDPDGWYFTREMVDVVITKAEMDRLAAEQEETE